MIRCTIGVLAYNEERSIVATLYALLNQRIQAVEFAEIVVVASGCTDRTVELARAVATQHSLIIVDTQPVRAGKAAAINRLIELAQGDIIVMVGADTLPDPGAIEHLVRPFADADVGMTGARVVPLNNPRHFMGFTVQMLWHVHHRMALRWPKLGELVAFRSIGVTLPENTATDEVALEALISAHGYRLVYVPEAIVYNYGPEGLGDFLLQRRRIFAGHLHIAKLYNYIAASLPMRHLLLLALDSADHYPSLIPLMTGAVLLECWGRALGLLDTLVGHRHHIWQPVASSKQVQRQGHGHMLTLVQLTYTAQALNPAALLRLARRVPASDGALLWWDHRDGKVLFLLSDDNQDSLENQIARLAEYVRDAQGTIPVTGCVVQFNAPSTSSHTRMFELDVPATTPEMRAL